MKHLSFHKLLFIRILLIIGLSIVALILYNKQLLYTVFFLGFCILFILIEIYFLSKKHYENIDRIVLAMLYDDFSLLSKNHQSNKTFEHLQSLYKKLQDKQKEHESKELVYLNILNNIETGIVILKQEQDTWSIFLMNDYFSNYFSVPKTHTWKSFSKMLPNLAVHLENLHFKESKSTLEIQLENEDKQTFMLQTSLAKSAGTTYYIVLLDLIQNVLEKKEKEAWINLMKIISHELMNSLTPIHSLAHNIQEFTTQKTLSEEDREDLDLSIKTIINRSNHLQHFIDNYRKLTMLPSPKKESVNALNVLNNSIETMRPLLRVQGIELKKAFSTDQYLLWDPAQMEQVFINLLTNAIHSLDESDNKQIRITAFEKNNRYWIEIIDTGMGIPNEIKDKIFIPFYTTRKEGAGIGLPLSKNIVEMHQGYLSYNQRNEETIFTLSFPLE